MAHYTALARLEFAMASPGRHGADLVTQNVQIRGTMMHVLETGAHGPNHLRG